jgi:hypothetical protein
LEDQTKMNKELEEEGKMIATKFKESMEKQSNMEI